jgi:hypothetical protein
MWAGCEGNSSALIVEKVACLHVHALYISNQHPVTQSSSGAGQLKNAVPRTTQKEVREVLIPTWPLVSHVVTFEIWNFKGVGEWVYGNHPCIVIELCALTSLSAELFSSLWLESLSLSTWALAGAPDKIALKPMQSDRAGSETSKAQQLQFHVLPSIAEIGGP